VLSAPSAKDMSFFSFLLIGVQGDIRIRLQKQTFLNGIPEQLSLQLK
jgi:hypothetical protein